MAIQTVPLVVLFQLFLCFTIKQINAGPQDPEYPELGENDRLANKIGWPKPAPYTAAGEEDKWHLALQSRSRLDCDFLSEKKYICNNAATKSTSVDTLTTEQACQEWCEDGVDSTPESSLEWYETAFCLWDNLNNLCTLEGCNQPIISSDSNYAYSACTQNNDFSYESPLWDTVIGDFVDAPDYTENACDQTVGVLRKDSSEIPNCWTKVNSNTKGRNLITEHYLNKQVTHVRIIMNGVDEIYSVDNQRVGIYTLKDLVTSAGGSLFSEFDKSNDYASKRGVGAGELWIDPVDSNVVACDHIGLNYLSITGKGGTSVGENALSARARIGVVMSNSGELPCTSRNYVQGVGIDVNYGAAAWACSGDGLPNCGGRLGSGQLSQNGHRSQFYRAEIWVTSTVVDENYKDRTPVFRQFGDNNKGSGFLTYRVPSLRHPNPGGAYCFLNPFLIEIKTIN